MESWRFRQSVKRKFDHQIMKHSDILLNQELNDIKINYKYKAIEKHLTL